MKNTHSSFSLLLSLGNLQHLQFLCRDLVRFSVIISSLPYLFCSLMSRYTLNPWSLICRFKVVIYCEFIVGIYRYRSIKECCNKKRSYVDSTACIVSKTLKNIFDAVISSLRNLSLTYSISRCSPFTAILDLFEVNTSVASSTISAS